MNRQSMSPMHRKLAVLGTIAITIGWAIMIYSMHLPEAISGAADSGPPGATKSSDKPSHIPTSPTVVADEMPRGPDAFAKLGTEKLETLLNQIDLVEREERLRRWMAIFELADVDTEVVQKLNEIATGRSPAASRYVRYVAAANVAGFGKPTRIGPNSIRPGIPPLGLYINLHRGLPIPHDRKRHLRLDPSVENLNVEVLPNADDNLRFQEILWTILEKYHLDFRTEPDGAFMIFPMKPPT